MWEQPKEKCGGPEVQDRSCLQVWLYVATPGAEPGPAMGATLGRSSKVIVNSLDVILTDRGSSGQDLWFLS